MLTVAPGGNNLATICYKDFLGLATINMYYYYYYYYEDSNPRPLGRESSALTTRPQLVLAPFMKKVTSCMLLRILLMHYRS